MKQDSKNVKLIGVDQVQSSSNEETGIQQIKIDLVSKYAIWKSDKTLINKYKNQGIKVLKGEQHKVVIQPFFAYPDEKGGLYTSDPVFNHACDLSILQQTYLKSLPFVKIIDSTSDEYKVGNIYLVKSDLAKIEHNPAYSEWYLRRASNPSMEGREPIPPQKYMGWDAWGNYRFQIDYFNENPTFEEFHVYLVPDMFLIGEKK